MLTAFSLICCLPVFSAQGSSLEEGSAAKGFPSKYDGPYKPAWESLKEHDVPHRLRDGKFGIYTHWGIYCVPAYGGIATWYINAVYTKPNSEARKHHEKTYGPLDEFGYKDYIPMFKAEKFDADEWQSGRMIAISYMKMRLRRSLCLTTARN